MHCVHVYCLIVMRFRLKMCISHVKSPPPNRSQTIKWPSKLYKVLNEPTFECSMEYVRVVEQIVCPQRQSLFRIFKNNNYRIGLNTTSNKFFYLNDLVMLDSLSYNFLHYKRVMKVQFLKYGKT